MNNEQLTTDLLKAIKSDKEITMLVDAYINGTTENMDCPGYYGAKFGGIKLDQATSTHKYDYSHGQAHQRYYSHLIARVESKYSAKSFVAKKACVLAVRDMIIKAW